MAEISWFSWWSLSISRRTLLLHGFRQTAFSVRGIPSPTSRSQVVIQYIYSCLSCMEANWEHNTIISIKKKSLFSNVISFHNQCLTEKISALRIKADGWQCSKLEKNKLVNSCAKLWSAVLKKISRLSASSHVVLIKLFYGGKLIEIKLRVIQRVINWFLKIMSFISVSSRHRWI